MTAEPIPLATQLADLRAAAEAHTGRCWLTRALEAMIMAALARIFGRLEELVRLWQAGLLPGLPARQAPAERPNQSPAANPRPGQTVRQSRRAGSRARPAVRRAPSNVVYRPAVPRASRVNTPGGRPTSAGFRRQPDRSRPAPPPQHPIAFQKPPSPGRFRTPYLFRYQNNIANRGTPANPRAPHQNE